jgi:PAS domain S-box-containing protein
MSGGTNRSYGEALRADSVEGVPRRALITRPTTDKETRGIFREAGVSKSIREVVSHARHELVTLYEEEDLHRVLFEKMPHPRFICDTRTLRFLEVNEAAVRHYGWSRDEFLRMTVTDLSAPQEASRLQEFCQEGCAHGFFARRQPNPVFRQQKKNGRWIDVEIDAALIPSRGRRTFLLLAQDVTRKQHAERRLRAQQAVTRALGESSTVAEAGPKIFQALCKVLECDWGELWRVDPSANVLRCTQTWHPIAQPSSEAEGVARHAVFVRGEGIAGAVWARNKPLWITDVKRQPGFQRSTAARYGLRTVFAFPIRLNQEVLAVIAIFSRQVLPPDKHLLHLLRDICSQIGQVMGRRRAERQLIEISEREQQRIGQDLHDGLCQQLTGIAYMASDLQTRLGRKSLPEAATAARIAELSRETAVQARQIARGLNPVKVGTVGLMAALEELTSSIRLMFSISCRFESAQRIFIRDHETAVHLYRIAQEAIHNAITHGKATRIVVSLSRQSGAIVLSVADNGRGLSRGSRDSSGTGFENMNYRARAIGAQLHFAPRNRGGTVMTCTLSQREGGAR